MEEKKGGLLKIDLTKAVVSCARSEGTLDHHS